MRERERKNRRIVEETINTTIKIIKTRRPTMSIDIFLFIYKHICADNSMIIHRSNRFESIFLLDFVVVYDTKLNIFSILLWSAKYLCSKYSIDLCCLLTRIAEEICSISTTTTTSR